MDGGSRGYYKYEKQVRQNPDYIEYQTVPPSPPTKERISPTPPYFSTNAVAMNAPCWAWGSCAVAEVSSPSWLTGTDYYSEGR